MEKNSVITRATDILNSFNQLDEDTQDKILNGVKCLAFLHNLADTDRAQKDLPPAQTA